jgi:hypothetical protein
MTFAMTNLLKMKELEKEIGLLQFSHPVQIHPTEGPTIHLSITFINVSKQTKFVASVTIDMSLGFYPNCSLDVKTDTNGK